MRLIFILALHLSAGLAPLAEWHSHEQIIGNSFNGWPDEFEGNPLISLPMTEKERAFSQGFPGKIGRFTDGSREIIIRHIERPSRKLHPSADCFRGSGYKVEPQPISRDKNDRLWGCVLAQRNGMSYRVCERIYDHSGSSWYDVSSWFWSVLLKNSQGPWLAVTVAERV